MSDLWNRLLRLAGRSPLATTPVLPPLREDLLPLIAAILGDGLGAGVEGGRALRRAHREGQERVGTSFWPYSPFGFRPGHVTDDSQMSLAALLALRELPDVSDALGRLTFSKRVAEAYWAWLRSDPPDVGGATRAALQHQSLDGGWSAWAGKDSAGNGSLMRATAPFAAGYRGESLLIASVLDGVLTHPDPRCVAACLWYAATLEAALEANAPERLAEAMTTGLARLSAVDAPTLLSWLPAGDDRLHPTFVERWPAACVAVTDAVLGAIQGEHVDCQSATWTEWPTGFVLSTLKQAAWAALQGAAASEALRLAVLHGGRDADTIGAVAGGLIGARFGTHAQWPAELLHQLTLGHRVAAFPRGASILEVLVSTAPLSTK